MNKLFIIFLCVVFVLFACEDNQEDVNESTPSDFSFESLTIENDTLLAGETSKVTAVATGDNLKYNWSASAGDLLGNGESVIYAPSYCHIGSNEIKCTVSDSNGNSETKAINVVVE